MELELLLQTLSSDIQKIGKTTKNFEGTCLLIVPLSYFLDVFNTKLNELHDQIDAGHDSVVADFESESKKLQSKLGKAEKLYPQIS